MRVLYIITRAGSGGAQTHVGDLLGAMSVGGSLHLAYGEAGRLSAVASVAGCSLHHVSKLQRAVSPCNELSVLRNLQQIIERVKPQLVHVHSSKAGLLGRIAARRAGVPCIYTAHGWGFASGAPIRQRILALAGEVSVARVTNHVICVSNYDSELALRIGLGRSKITCIHNGISPAASVVPRVGGRPDMCRAIMVARFGPQKDHKTLLRAAAKVPALECEFVGDGPEVSSIRGEAQRLGICGRVRFMGDRIDVSEYLKSADVFCLISNYEGFPYTTLEAMREGLPTLVSDVGGAGEAVVEGETGFLIPRGNVEVLAQRLALLVNNSELRRRMGKAAKEHFEQNFTFDRMFDQTLRVYEEVLAGRK